MPEGSVHVDNGGADLSSDSADVKDTSVKDTSTDAGAGGAGAGDSQDHGSEGGEGKDTLTDKGTKLDPNPESAVHQKLANAEKKIRDYETVLRSPELLKQFAKAAGYTLEEAKAALKDEKENAEDDLYSPDKLQTAEDLSKALKELRATSVKGTKAYEEKITKLEQQLSELTTGRHIERVTTTLASDISAAREKYPVLNPKSPEYDKDLEREIGEMFNDLDYDERTKSYRGNYSLLAITDRVMRIRGQGKKKGSEEAQTDVIVKERGKVTTGSKPASASAESDDPGTTIAQRIAKSLKKTV